VAYEATVETMVATAEERAAAWGQDRPASVTSALGDTVLAGIDAAHGGLVKPQAVLRLLDGDTRGIFTKTLWDQSMRQYGWFANRLGAEHAADSFPAAGRAEIVDNLESLCTVALGAALGAGQLRVRDLVDEPFRVAMLACIDGTAGCVEPARSFHAWLLDDVVTADPAGARVLIVQGLGDQVMPAASQAACDVAKLRAEGVTPEVCSDTFATHDTVLERKIEHAAAWAEAAATGAATPACASSFLPTCAP
jgi:hypothetical protein